jgi:modulator of FtsH protease HflK
VVVAPKSGNLLYLPLDRLMQQSGAPPAGAGAGADAGTAGTLRAVPPVEPPAASDSGRTRESLRRERGG